MTKAEAAIAFAEGKNVEWSWGDGHWFAVDTFRYFDMEGTQFRPKPEPIPPGDLTYDEAVECIKRHEPVQWFNGSNGWVDSDANTSWCAESLGQFNRYRRKPAPKRVPLGSEDVPPGATIRYCSWLGKGEVQWFYKDENAVSFRVTSDFTVTYKKLMESYEISRDGGKTWHGCWKEVAE